jgi:hypothetical protein
MNHEIKTLRRSKQKKRGEMNVRLSNWVESETFEAEIEW